MLINRSILPSVPAPGQHSAHPSDLKGKPPSSLTASPLLGTVQHPRDQRDFPERPGLGRCRGVMQEPLRSCCGTLSAQSGRALLQQEQPKASSIPPPALGASLLPKSQLLGPQHVKEQLQGCSKDLCPIPHLLPPQQRLLDKADLAAHCETTLPAQPFPLTQFMPGIKTSLGSPLTAASICRVGRRRAWREVGKLQSH